MKAFNHYGFGFIGLSTIHPFHGFLYWMQPYAWRSEINVSQCANVVVIHMIQCVNAGNTLRTCNNTTVYTLLKSTLMWNAVSRKLWRNIYISYEKGCAMPPFQEMIQFHLKRSYEWGECLAVAESQKIFRKNFYVW